MKILMVTAEAVPYAKTGGLADMVSALALSLHRAGHDVRIVMPRYYAINRSALRLIPEPMGVPVGSLGEQWTAVYATELPGSARANGGGLPVYFIDHEQSFGRDGVYGSPAESDFHDNPARFSVLCNGAFQLCRKLGWFPDVIHAHDWSAALAPVLLKFVERRQGFGGTASVFTIHNLGYQGNYSKDSFPALGLGWEHFFASGFEDWDRINFLKAGLCSADALTTVSPTYAAEIQSSEHGFRMDGVLRSRSGDLYGILNGVDTEIWNPAKDKRLARTYTARTLAAGKALNKAALQQRMGLPADASVPLIGMVTRLTDQKGVAEVFAPTFGCAYRLCSQIPLQFAVLGAGERWCQDEIRQLESKLPNFRAYLGYDDGLSHQIEAGSDFFLMPSRYEPCGLNQMYSLLYGTLPIVRRTGGLADTVQNYDDKTGGGTGFMFDYLSPQSVFDTVCWAVYAWSHRPDHIAHMRKRAMQQEFGWSVAAARYADVYEAALKKLAR